MTIRMHNLDKWAQLQAGNVLELVGNDDRRIRLEFNVVERTKIDVIDGNGVTTFLGMVEGYDVVEFYSTATVHVVATPFVDDAEVWYFTNDGEVIASDTPESVSFTRIAGRKERNPELERMMMKLEANMLRRVEAERVALEAERGQLEQLRATVPVIEENADENSAPDAGGSAASAAPEAAEPAAEPAAGKAAKS